MLNEDVKLKLARGRVLHELKARYPLYEFSDSDGTKPLQFFVVDLDNLAGVLARAALSAVKEYEDSVERLTE